MKGEHFHQSNAAKEFSDYSLEEQERSQSQNKKPIRVREENSLSLLTKKFIQMMKESETGTIDLNQARIIMNVKKRRIYDITNVLEGINYVNKLQKNTIKWLGEQQDPELQMNIQGCLLELEKYEKESAQLDEHIQKLTKKLNSSYLQNQQLKPLQFITFKDCMNICNSMTKESDKKQVIFFSAPKATTLSIRGQEQGTTLSMNCEGKGHIRAYRCSGKENQIKSMSD